MGGGKRIVDRRFQGEDANEKIAIHQIMLKYRPIAPRPVIAESSCRLMTCVRSKRKYVRVMNKYKDKDKVKSCSDKNLVRVKKKDKAKTDSDMNLGNAVRKEPKYWNNFIESRTTGCCDVKNCNFFMSNEITPSLTYLHEADLSVAEHGNAGTGCCDVKNPNFCMNNKITSPPKYLHDADLSVAVRGGNVMKSWITTESLTCACEVGRWLGFADNEIRKNLEKDSSPGFISNCFDEVEWVNLAYRRIGDTRLDGGGPPPDVVVWLAVKFEKLVRVKYWHCFSCRVRVEYEFLNKKGQMTVPCDVWKMDCGGFAWRLDVGAALCLGRIS